jgi:hypothetical protein
MSASNYSYANFNLAGLRCIGGKDDVHLRRKTQAYIIPLNAEYEEEQVSQGMWEVQIYQYPEYVNLYRNLPHYTKLSYQNQLTSYQTPS